MDGKETEMNFIKNIIYKTKRNVICALFLTAVFVLGGFVILREINREDFRMEKNTVDMSEMKDEIPVKITTSRSDIFKDIEVPFVLGNRGNLYFITKDEETYLLKKYSADILQDKQIVDISKGQYHTVVLDNEGRVYTWGSNSYGQLGQDTGEYIKEALLLEDVTGVDKIYAGFYMTALLTDDSTLYIWGRANTNEKEVIKSEPLIINTDFSISKVVDAEDELFILSEDMELWNWKAGSLNRIDTNERVIDIGRACSGFWLRTEEGQVYVCNEAFLEEGYEKEMLGGVSFSHINIPLYVNAISANMSNAVAYTGFNYYYIWGIQKNSSFLGFTSLERKALKKPVEFEMDDVKEFAVIGHGNIGVIDENNKIYIYKMILE